jgi:TetR/AcrR family transcriptional regulator
MPADSAATRMAILDAADAQFSEHGFAGASLSMIAEAAQVSKALLHHHYGSKEGLWHAVKERRFAEFWPEQSQLAQGKLDRAWFADSMKAYFTYLQAHPSFVRLMTWQFLERRPNDASPDQGPPQFREAARRIRESQKAGFLRDDVDPFHVVIMFFCLTVHWHEAKALYLSFLERPIKSMKRADASFLEDVLAVFLRGLGAKQ